MCEHCDGPVAIRHSLLSLPGVKRVEMETVFHVFIVVDETSEEQRRVIYEQELRLIKAYPEIPLDFNLCRGDL
jgi:hypothetical protein